MSKRGKFEKLEINDSYYDTHEDVKIKDVPKKKKGLFSDIDFKKIPEKKEPSSEFTYTAETRKTIYNISEENGALPNPERAPYVLVFVVMLLTVLAGALASGKLFLALSYEKACIAKILMMVCIYFVPSIVYIFSSPSRMRLYNIRRFPISMLPITFVTLCLVSSVTFLQTYFITYTFSYNVAVGASPDNVLLAIVTGALVPAICEELFVRGVLQHEISKYAGGFTGVLCGAVVFAMLHMELQYFTVYLVSGIILGALTHITQSVFPAILVHFLNNTISILFADKVSYIALRRISGRLFMIVLAVLSFIFLIAMLRYAEGISIKRAANLKKDEGTKTNDESQEDDGIYVKSETVDESRLFFAAEGKTMTRMGRVLSSPFMLASYAVFVVIVVINFFA